MVGSKESNGVTKRRRRALRPRRSASFFPIFGALVLLASLVAQSGFVVDLPQVGAAVGELSVSDHEGQEKNGVVGAYVNGNVTQYAELESVNYRLIVTSIDTDGPAASGDFVIEWTGDSRPGMNTCL